MSNTFDSQTDISGLDEQQKESKSEGSRSSSQTRSPPTKKTEEKIAAYYNGFQSKERYV